MNTAQISDLKPGVVVFTVTVVPNHSTGTVISSIQEITLTSIPRKSQFSDAFFVAYTTKTSWSENYQDDFSIEDYNIVKNGYNVHQVFTSRDDAEAYVERMSNPHNWTDYENRILVSWMKRQEREEEFDYSFGYDD